MTQLNWQAWRPRLARIGLVTAGLSLLLVWRGTPTERTLVFEWGSTRALRKLDLVCSTDRDEVSGASFTFSDPVPARVSHRVSVSAPELRCDLDFDVGSRKLQVSRRLVLDAEEIRVPLGGVLAEARTTGEP